MALFSDVRFAWRVLVRRPAVPAMIAGLFALSVGLASGLWAVIDAVLLRPLPYRDGDAIVAVMETHPQRGMMAVTAANFLDWRERVTTLQDVTGLGGLEASIVGRGEPERVIGTKVTERFFELMGVPAAPGRGLNASDFHTAARVVVISDHVWERQFRRDPAVIGATLRIDGDAWTVVGVMPRTFKTIGNSEIWTPWTMTPEERGERRFHSVGVMARLRSGRTAADASRELEAIYARLRADHRETAGWSASAQPLRHLMLGDTRQALALLGGAIVVLLVVASINVASLLSAWLPTRRREFLVRLALGAPAARVVRQLLAEALTWAVVGMAGGLALALAFVRLFGAVGIASALEYDFEPAIDVRVVLAMSSLLVVDVLVTTLAPCILSVRRSTDLAPRRASATGVFGRRLTLAVQVMLSALLLCTAAQLLVGLGNLSGVAARGAPRGVAMDLTLPDTRYKDEVDQRRFFARLLSAIESRPEIRAAATASYVPPARIYGNVRFEIEGRSTPSDANTALVSGVSPGVFGVLNIGLRRGRLLDDRDVTGAPHAAVISAALARRYWPAEDPIGRRLRLIDVPQPITIVGVVEDVRQPLSGDPRAESVLYLSSPQLPVYFATLLIAPSGDAAPALAAVRQEIARLDPALAPGAPRTIDAIRGEWLEQPRLRTRIVMLFGASTLLLTLVGLYARVAYAAAARTRELAIRHALGAQSRDLVRILTGEALVVVVIGVLMAMLLLPVVSTSLQALVGGVAQGGLVQIAAVAISFGAAAFASAYWPARRAGRVNVATLLRSE